METFLHAHNYAIYEYYDVTFLYAYAFFPDSEKTNKKHLFKFPFNSKAAVHTNSSSFTQNFIQVPWIQIYLLLPGGVHSEKAALSH